MIFKIIFLTLFLVFSTKISKVASVIEVNSDSGPHFRDVVKSREFVDKSLLIRHILEGREHMVIEAPRGFGKTTNLRMLKEFLELEVDADGRAVTTNTTQNYKTFASPPLKIFLDAPELFKAYFGQYPVLYIDLESLSVTSFKTFEDSFRQLVADMFFRFEYLLKSNKLGNIVRDDFLMYRDQSPELGIDEIALGGEKLAWILWNHHKHDIVVLIDNYDAPINKAVITAVTGLDIKGFDGIYEKVAAFISGLVTDKRFVARSVMTGRLRIGVGHNGIQDNLVHYHVFEDDQLYRYYGLDEDDIVELVNRVKEKPLIEVIKKWYGGYTTGNPAHKLYNTLSTTSYFKTGKLKRQRIESENFRHNLSNLLPYERMGKKLEETFDQTTHIHTIKLNQASLKELRMMNTVPGYKINQDLVLQFLVENGFYTIDDDRLTIPNLELDQDLKALVLTRDYLKSKFDISEAAINGYIDSMDRLDNSESSYRNFVGAVLGLFESRMPRTSREFLHTLLYLVTDTKFANVTSGEDVDPARHDFFLERYDATGIMIGVEIDNAFEGLQKIVDNKYYNVFNKSLVKTRILIGVSISKRRKGTVTYLNNPSIYSMSGCRNLTLQGRRRGKSKDEK